MALRLLGPRILIKPEKMPEKTEGGIIIPDFLRDNTSRAEVIGVGSGHRTRKGYKFPVCVSAGDRVFYSRNAGHAVVDEGNQYEIINDEHVIAIEKRGQENAGQSGID